MERTIILIDGSNLYFKLKSLSVKSHLQFNYSEFIKFLAGKRKNVSTTYFIGKVRTDKTEKSKKLHAGQRKLLSRLSKHNISYKLGYLLKSNGKYHEKGVDIQIAVDLLVAAYENHADRIILVSSDTDLIPAVKKAQEMGKVVEYVGFSHQKSIALVAECKESRLLKLEDIEAFFSK